MTCQAARAAAIAVLVVLLAPAQIAHAQDAHESETGERGPLVTGVDLRGVTSFDAGALRDGLATQASACKSLLYTPVCWITDSDNFVTRRYLDAIELRRDVLRIRLFYWRRGYRDTRAVSRTEPSGDGVRVIFEVTEGPPTIAERLDVVQADSVLPRRSIDGAMQLRAGDRLDLIAIDSSIMLLRDELWNRGYADAEIDLDTARVSEERNAGPVTITLRSGPLGTVHSIAIDGNEKISERTIRRLLTFRPGDRYRRDLVLESQRNLYLSGLFTEVDLQGPSPGDPTQADSAKDVRLRVVEGDLRQLELTGGFTTADFLQLEAQFIRYNFLGAARRLTIRGTVSNLMATQLNGAGIFNDVTNGAQGSERDIFLAPTWSASIDFTQPWFLTPRNQLGASIFGHRRSVPGVVVDRGAGATMAFTRDFGPRSSGTLSYTYEESAIDASDVYFCVTFGVCVVSTINVLARRNPLAPIAAVLQVDRSNDPFTPDRGFRVRAEAEHASTVTASDFQYNRVAVSGSKYLRVNRAGVLAGRVRLGWVSALGGTSRTLRVTGNDDELIVHPRRRFYAGGSQSVRGFGENQLGPRVLTISPEALTDTALATPCSEQELANLTCNPNRAGVNASDFQPQAVGGTSLAEASIEYRFDLFEGLGGAMFIDGAIIGTNSLSGLLGATGTVTPGFGVRLDTPVGLVRLDLGVRPRVVEDLPVITQVTAPDGSLQLVTLNTPRRYDPTETSGNWLTKALGRLTLHLSIGPAF